MYPFGLFGSTYRTWAEVLEREQAQGEVAANVWRPSFPDQMLMRHEVVASGPVPGRQAA